MPRRGSQPPFLNLPLLIVILPTVALLVFLFFAFYSFTSTTSPHRTLRVGASNSTVKKGWDSLNAFLVLFAILCGIFAKRNDDESPPNEEDSDNHLASRALPVQRGRTAVSDQWFHQLSEDKFYDETTPLRRLTRSSSSYPDLRQESLRETENDRSRFFDDFEISKYRQSSAPLVSVNRPYKSPPIASDEEEKEIPVDTSALRSLPTPPKSPPPATAKHMPKRTYTTIPRKEVEIKIKSPPPPPPAPPQPAAKENGSERRIELKKSNAAKEIKMVFTSLYNNSQRKRKKKTKDINWRDEPLDSGLEPASFTRPPPSPPPPPPSSLFRNLFIKRSKSKRIHSYSAPPPPPPPLPPISVLSRRKARPPPPATPPPVPRATPPPEPSKRRSSPANSWKPPLPPTARENTFLEDFDNSGGQSPLIPMPPPPPPPFKVPGFRFAVKGDYVKVGSANSSRSTSPEPAEIERESKEKVDTGGGGGGPVFCPSPDVNVKADTFIAMLRDGWRLEKEKF